MRKSEALQDARDYGSFLHERQSSLLQADTLAGIGSRNMTGWGSHPPLVARLDSDIRARKPFSFIRLGDGEGNVLFWGTRRNDFPKLARFGMDGIWFIMFGGPGEVAYFDRIHDGMAQAVRGADYLGISQLSAYERSASMLRDCPLEELDVRGQAGAVGVWDWVSEHMKNEIQDGEPVLVNAWFHGELVPAVLRDLLDGAERLSLITCHPTLMERFVAAFGVRPGRTYLIPPQYSNVKQRQDVPHYPVRFEQITAELAGRDLTGELFLIGAGIIGKIYCELVKRQGGMAIDAGSMMDVWMGIGVRQYQDAAFVDKRRLSPMAQALPGQEPPVATGRDGSLTHPLQDPG